MARESAMEGSGPDRVRQGHSSRTYLGDPEIDQYDIFHSSVLGTVQEVIGFDIPMYNPLIMDKRQGIL